MPWYVSSSIDGKQALEVEAGERFEALAHELRDCAQDYALLHQRCATLTFTLSTLSGNAPLCPSLGAHQWTESHAWLDRPALQATLDIVMPLVQRLGERLNDLSTRLAQAAWIYHHADAQARESANNLIGVAASYALPLLGGASLITAIPGIAYDTALDAWASWRKGHALGNARNLNTPSRQSGIAWIGGVRSSAWLHEIMTAAIGYSMQGFGRKSAPLVASGAHRVSALSSGLSRDFVGSKLVVTRVLQPRLALTQSNTMPQALRNLRLLAQGAGTQEARLPHTTLAIQRYRKPDGSNAWLVLIPGTRNETNSAFGWLQNVQVMSSEALDRRQAMSTQMVMRAMREAGVQARDDLMLVGHSQGGIVAASIAADAQYREQVRHVVTAGSPIAQHPIPHSTTVTSIEMDDELVAAADAKPNPATKQWLTIRAHGIRLPEGMGTAPPVSKPSAQGNAEQPAARGSAALQPVDVADESMLTHDLHFHEAALAHAHAYGSPTLARHEQHFAQSVQGTLMETTYWHGEIQ